MPGMFSVGFCGNTVKISSTDDEAYTSYSTITIELLLASLSNLEHRSVLWMSTQPIRKSRLHLRKFCTFITQLPYTFTSRLCISTADTFSMVRNRITLRCSRLDELTSGSSMVISRQHFYSVTTEPYAQHPRHRHFVKLRRKKIRLVAFFTTLVILRILRNNSLWNIFQEFQQYFSWLSKIFLEIFLNFSTIFQNNSRKFPEYYPNFFLENISRNFLKYFSKISEVFLEIFEIFWKWFSKISNIIHKISWNYSPNSPQ